MQRKLNKKRASGVAVLFAALLLVTGACIAVLVSHGKDKVKENQPLLCEEPVFPETLPAEGGTYIRRLSTYWWVKDVRNGKVIIKDINRSDSGKDDADDLGVADLQGRVVITCDNREVHFTDNGYIGTLHFDSAKGVSTYNYFNMGGNCLASMESVTPEAKGKYEGASRGSEPETFALTEDIDGVVRYYGKYIAVSQYDSPDRSRKNNTCIYEYRSAQ